MTFEAEIDPKKISIARIANRSPVRSKIYAKDRDNARTRFQHFCAECSAPLFTSGDAGPDRLGDTLGQYPRRPELKPARQIWCRSAAPWIDDLGKVPGGLLTRGLATLHERVGKG